MGTTPQNQSWYEKNKETHKVNVYRTRAIRREEAQTYIRALKMSTPCTDCGLHFHFCVMDFDHLHGKEKNIANMVNEGYKLNTIKKEIDKCELVCSNCHRLRTWNRSH